MYNSLTDIEDIDYQILNHLDSKALVNICQASKKMASYCEYTNLWESKLINEGYYFITDYPETSNEWITLFKRLNKASDDLNRLLLICNITNYKGSIYINGPEKIIHSIIKAYDQDNIRKYIRNNQDSIIITLKNNKLCRGNTSLTMPSQDLEYILLIAFYMATFNNYEDKNNASKLLLVVDNGDIPFIIDNNTHNYIDEDDYYKHTYKERHTIMKTLNYIQKNYNCIKINK